MTQPLKVELKFLSLNHGLQSNIWILLINILLILRGKLFWKLGVDLEIYSMKPKYVDFQFPE